MAKPGAHGFRPWRWIALTAAAVAALATVFPWSFVFRGNLHTVIDGKVYRSAAPSPADLDAWTKRFALRSVLNLKGRKHRGRTDVQTIANVEFLYLRLSAQRWPSPAELQSLVAALDAAPRPVLLHCASGVDRTGLAAAITLLLEGEPIERARDQFALTHGYLAPPIGSSLPNVIKSYESWVNQERVPHSPERFRNWVEHRYIASYYRAEIRPMDSQSTRQPDENFTLDFRVTNQSVETIPLACSEIGVRLAIRIQSLDPEVPFSIEHRACSSAGDLPVGASTLIQIADLRVPSRGAYRLEADLVDEVQEHTFAEMGSTPLSTTFDVPAAGTGNQP